MMDNARAQNLSPDLATVASFAQDSGAAMGDCVDQAKS
jgi:hypothetical protein